VSFAERVRGRMRQWRRDVGEEAGERVESGFQRLVASRKAMPLNRYQQAFCEWNAQRLGIALDESRQRFEDSMRTFRGGHAGLTFRTFNDVSHSLYAVFANDTEREVYDAYRLHTPAHFLRQLSATRTPWSRPCVRTTRQPSSTSGAGWHSRRSASASGSGR
jgi:hypothetical protein